MSDVQRINGLKGSDRDLELTIMAQNLSENMNFAAEKRNAKKFIWAKLSGAWGFYVTVMYLLIKVIFKI